MSRKFAVIGATGVLGRHVLPRLIERGHEVKFLTTKDPAPEPFLSMGAVPVAGDIFDKSSLRELIGGTQAVLNLATRVPPAGPGADWSENDRIRRQGTANVISAMHDSGATHLVQQSIALIHAGTGNVVTETSPVSAGPVTASAIEMEAMLEHCGLNVSIARGAMFYGPGTGRIAAWRSQLKQGLLKLPADGSDFVSLIHTIDMARAIIALAEAEDAIGAWLVCDDEPISYENLFQHLALLEGVPAPERGGPPLLPSLNASNTALKLKFGWKPVFPTWRSGLL